MGEKYKFEVQRLMHQLEDTFDQLQLTRKQVNERDRLYNSAAKKINALKVENDLLKTKVKTRKIDHVPQHINIHYSKIVQIMQQVQQVLRNNKEGSITKLHRLQRAFVKQGNLFAQAQQQFIRRYVNHQSMQAQIEKLTSQKEELLQMTTQLQCNLKQTNKIIKQLVKQIQKNKKQIQNNETNLIKTQVKKEKHKKKHEQQKKEEINISQLQIKSKTIIQVEKLVEKIKNSQESTIKNKFQQVCIEYVNQIQHLKKNIQMIKEQIVTNQNNYHEKEQSWKRKIQKYREQTNKAYKNWQNQKQKLIEEIDEQKNRFQEQKIEKQKQKQHFNKQLNHIMQQGQTKIERLKTDIIKIRQQNDRLKNQSQYYDSLQVQTNQLKKKLIQCQQQLVIVNETIVIQNDKLQKINCLKIRQNLQRNELISAFQQKNKTSIITEKEKLINAFEQQKANIFLRHQEQKTQLIKQYQNKIEQITQKHEQYKQKMEQKLQIQLQQMKSEHSLQQNKQSKLEINISKDAKIQQLQRILQQERQIAASVQRENEQLLECIEQLQQQLKDLGNKNHTQQSVGSHLKCQQKIKISNRSINLLPNISQKNLLSVMTNKLTSELRIHQMGSIRKHLSRIKGEKSQLQSEFQILTDNYKVASEQKQAIRKELMRIRDEKNKIAQSLNVMNEEHRAMISERNQLNNEINKLQSVERQTKKILLRVADNNPPAELQNLARDIKEKVQRLLEQVNILRGNNLAQIDEKEQQQMQLSILRRENTRIKEEKIEEDTQAINLLAVNAPSSCTPQILDSSSPYQALMVYFTTPQKELIESISFINPKTLPAKIHFQRKQITDQIQEYQQKCAELTTQNNLLKNNIYNLEREKKAAQDLDLMHTEDLENQIKKMVEKCQMTQSNYDQLQAKYISMEGINNRLEEENCTMKRNGGQQIIADLQRDLEIMKNQKQQLRKRTKWAEQAAVRQKNKKQLAQNKLNEIFKQIQHIKKAMKISSSNEKFLKMFDNIVEESLIKTKSQLPSEYFNNGENTVIEEIKEQNFILKKKLQYFLNEVSLKEQQIAGLQKKISRNQLQIHNSQKQIQIKQGKIQIFSNNCLPSILGQQSKMQHCSKQSHQQLIAQNQRKQKIIQHLRLNCEQFQKQNQEIILKNTQSQNKIKKLQNQLLKLFEQNKKINQKIMVKSKKLNQQQLLLSQHFSVISQTNENQTDSLLLQKVQSQIKIGQCYAQLNEVAINQQLKEKINLISVMIHDRQQLNNDLLAKDNEIKSLKQKLLSIMVESKNKIKQLNVDIQNKTHQINQLTMQINQLNMNINQISQEHNSFNESILNNNSLSQIELQKSEINKSQEVKKLKQELKNKTQRQIALQEKIKNLQAKNNVLKEHSQYENITMLPNNSLSQKKKQSQKQYGLNFQSKASILSDQIKNHKFCQSQQKKYQLSGQNMPCEDQIIKKLKMNEQQLQKQKTINVKLQQQLNEANKMITKLQQQLLNCKQEQNKAFQLGAFARRKNLQTSQDTNYNELLSIDFQLTDSGAFSKKLPFGSLYKNSLLYSVCEQNQDKSMEDAVREETDQEQDQSLQNNNQQKVDKSILSKIKKENDLLKNTLLQTQNLLREKITLIQLNSKQISQMKKIFERQQKQKQQQEIIFAEQYSKNFVMQFPVKETNTKQIVAFD